MTYVNFSNTKTHKYMCYVFSKKNNQKHKESELPS